MTSSEMEIDVDFSAEHYKLLKEESKTRFLRSSLAFLNAHNGWRKGKLHVFLGKTSGGKSTLMRTLLADSLDAAQEGKKIGLILSEETKIDFLNEFNWSGKFTELAKKLKVASEKDYPQLKNRDNWLKLTKRMVDEGCQVIFHDNPTTSAVYGSDFKSQTEMAHVYKDLAKAANIPIVLFAHTNRVNENHASLISEDDIRGSKELVNLAEFFYILQTFNVENKKHTFLRIVKNRGQDIENYNYKLNYIPEFRAYLDVDTVNFSEIKEIFKKRNKL